MRRALVIALVLVGLLVGVDRIGVLIAQPVAAHALQRHFGLQTKPQVHIHGFPFLTQAIAGHYDDVTMSMTGFTAGKSGRTVRIERLNGRFTDLHTSTDFTTAHADNASGSVLLRYPDLSRALGADLGFGGRGSDGHGRIKARRTVSVLGQSLTGTASAGVAVSGPMSLAFSAPQIDLGGAAVPQPIVDALTSTFAAPLTLNGLPAGLRLDSVQVTADGLVIMFSGKNVDLGER